MLYPWVQLLKWEGIAPFGPNLAADHAQSMRANTFVPVAHVLFVVESSRPERGWTRFVLRDPTGTVPAGTTDSDVAAKLVVGAAVKLTNVRLVPDSAFCGRLGIVIAWENLGRVVAPKSKPGKPHTNNISTFKETTPFSIYTSLEGVKKDEVADITYRQFRAEWTRRHPSPTAPPPPPPLPTHTTATVSSGDESCSSPSKEVLQQQPVAETVDAFHHLVEEEEEDAGESDLSQPSDLPSSQPSEGDSSAGQRRTSAKRRYLKRVESDPTLPDSQPSPQSPRAFPRAEESETAKHDDVDGSDDDEEERKASTNAEAATTAKRTKAKAKKVKKAKAKAKSEAEDELVKRKRGRPKKEAIETEEERIKKHRKSEEHKKKFVELFIKHAKPKVVMTPVVPLDEQARQLLDRCEFQQSQRLSQHRSQRAKSQRIGDNENESEDELEAEAEADSEEDLTQDINQLEVVLTQCKQLCEKELVVFSLFDGIAGALRALKLLGIRVKAYFVVEKDPLAMDVVRANFPPEEHPYIRYLGCVEKITTADLEDIVRTVGPVDLFIGGSPCTDLSVLGKKKGLDCPEGSSYHFYDFLRILQDLRRLCNSDSHNVFFLLENVASMSRKDKTKISDCMGVEPVRIDSKDITNVRRNRYYWHNIPRNINALPKATFQELLSQDGEALVLVGGCITTHNATMEYLKKSLEELLARPQDLKRYNTIKIKGQDKCRSLKATEMERILGFRTKDSNEREYTKEGRDINGRVYILTKAQRNKLLGQSFDTRVIAHLLTPLLKLCAGEEQLESRILQIRRQVTLSQMHFVQPRPRPAAAAVIDKGKDKAIDDDDEDDADEEEEDDDDDFPLTQAG